MVKCFQQDLTLSGWLHLNCMKHLSILLLVLLLVGCAQHYNITLSNNNVLTSTGKPRYNRTNETYEFKDSFGKTTSIPAFKIKEIAAQ
jgi:ABC-type Fe3+-hydroxamate transport system substrate-binding protein